MVLQQAHFGCQQLVLSPQLPAAAAIVRAALLAQFLPQQSVLRLQPGDLAQPAEPGPLGRFCYASQSFGSGFSACLVGSGSTAAGTARSARGAATLRGGGGGGGGGLGGLG